VTSASFSLLESFFQVVARSVETSQGLAAASPCAHFSGSTLVLGRQRERVRHTIVYLLNGLGDIGSPVGDLMDMLVVLHWVVLHHRAVPPLDTVNASLHVDGLGACPEVLAFVLEDLNNLQMFLFIDDCGP
jgi:hypothetical protein